MSFTGPWKYKWKKKKHTYRHYVPHTCRQNSHVHSKFYILVDGTPSLAYCPLRWNYWRRESQVEVLLPLSLFFQDSISKTVSVNRGIANISVSLKVLKDPGVVTAIIFTFNSPVWPLQNYMGPERWQQTITTWPRWNSNCRLQYQAYCFYLNRWTQSEVYSHWAG